MGEAATHSLSGVLVEAAAAGDGKRAKTCTIHTSAFCLVVLAFECAKAEKPFVR